MAIAEAIIAMGKTLSLTVVAEGVETPEQQAFLSDRWCDEMQGYYFSTPVAAQDARSSCVSTSQHLGVEPSRRSLNLALAPVKVRTEPVERPGVVSRNVRRVSHRRGHVSLSYATRHPARSL
jgi:hypothetical protein